MSETLAVILHAVTGHNALTVATWTLAAVTFASLPDGRHTIRRGTRWVCVHVIAGSRIALSHVARVFRRTSQ